MGLLSPRGLIIDAVEKGWIEPRVDHDSLMQAKKANLQTEMDTSPWLILKTILQGCPTLGLALPISHRFDVV